MGPEAGSPSDGSPDGVSTARINAGDGDVALPESRLRSSIACAGRPVTGPRRPVPNKASITTSAEAIWGRTLSHSAFVETVERTPLDFFQRCAFLSASP